MQITIRLDRNGEYAKETVKLIDNTIYIVDESICGLSFHLLNDRYIEYAKKKYSENVIILLKLIWEHYFDFIKAINFVIQQKHCCITDVVKKGCTVSDW